MLEVVQLINSIYESITYLVIDNNSKICFLIDCGDSDLITHEIHKRGLFLKGIFITHSHFDHIYGLNYIMNEYPKIPVYTSAFGKKGLCSDKLNLSRYHLHPYIFQYCNTIKVLNEADIANFCTNSKIEIFMTPGHDKSCLTYKIDNNLFTGDSFIPNIKVITLFPNSNKVDAEVSKLRILSLSKDCNLYPGHGRFYEKFQPELYL